MVSVKATAAVWLTLCAALFLRAAVPSGWMLDIDPADGSLTLRICEAQTPAIAGDAFGQPPAADDRAMRHHGSHHSQMPQVHPSHPNTDSPVDDHSQHHPSGKGQSEPPCAFSGFGGGLLLPEQPPVIAIAPPSEQLRIGHIARLSLGRIAYSIPPARGPPARS